jgi:hypothetical protein
VIVDWTEHVGGVVDAEVKERGGRAASDSSVKDTPL